MIATLCRIFGTLKDKDCTAAIVLVTITSVHIIIVEASAHISAVPKASTASTKPSALVAIRIRSVASPAPDTKELLSQRELGSLRFNYIIEKTAL